MSEFKSPFPDMKIHLWVSFNKFLYRLRPRYREACDALTLLEGGTHTVVGKLFAHPKAVSRYWICIDCKSEWVYPQPVGIKIVFCQACGGLKLIPGDERDLLLTGS